MSKTSFTAPQVSTQAFVPPVINPVKQAPKISDLVNDPVSNVVVAEPAQTETPSTPTDTSVSSSDASVSSTATPRENEVTETSESYSGEVSADESAPATVDEDFENAWNTMFDLLFAKIATVYYPLKGVVPQLKDNVIYVKVKNELMKENFEPQIRLALEYLRNNYSPQIDNIVVQVDEVKEEKSTFIYDTQDKMNDLRRENPEIPEFLRILNLSVKDM